MLNKILIVILQDIHLIPPFNERACDLRIHNQKLSWLQQTILKNVLKNSVKDSIETKEVDDEAGAKGRLPQTKQPMLVYRDNLFFDEWYINKFIRGAIKCGRPVRAAFSLEDKVFLESAYPLSTSYTPAGPLYLADLWYYPNGPEADVDPLVINLQAIDPPPGYYQVPKYMTGEQRDLVFQIPKYGALLAIDCWEHIFIADIVFGVFANAARKNDRANVDPWFKLKMLGTALYEGRQVLESSVLVTVGKDPTIDPSAVIHGPTTIGDNVKIEAGVVIDNCQIGNNVTISQGCQLYLSVVGNNTFLPFRAALFMTTIMEYSMVAQNTCLQLCVIGSKTFIGAGSTFTDFNLMSAPIKALDGRDELKPSKRPILGGCVGHNCRIGSGMVIYPARTIESDVVLTASKERRVIDKDIKYEDSDHHKMRPEIAIKHQHLYPRKKDPGLESW